MKIKKIVSAISSLTIAASAFAGLAVTANAATGTIGGSFADNKFTWTTTTTDAQTGLPEGSYSTPDDDTYADLTFVSGSSDSISADGIYISKPACGGNSEVTLSNRYIKIQPKANGKLNIAATISQISGNSGNYTGAICVQDITDSSSFTSNGGVVMGTAKPTFDAPKEITGSADLQKDHTYVVFLYEWYATKYARVDALFTSITFEPTYTLTVNAVDSNNTIIKEINTYNACGSYTYYYPRYIQVDTKLYETPASSSGDNTYYGNTVDVASDKVENITYNEVEYSGKLVLAEDLDNSTSENANVRASNGSAYNNKTYTSDLTLETGIYKFIIGYQSKGRGSTLNVGNTVIRNLGSSDEKGAWRTATVDNVKITESGNIQFVSTNGSSVDCLDTIIVIKTGELPTTHSEGFEFKNVSFSELDNESKFEVTIGDQINAKTFGDLGITIDGEATGIFSLLLTDIPEGKTASVNLIK